MFDDFDNKCAPRTLDDMVFRSETDKKTLRGCITGAAGFPAGGKNGILLYGPVGTGKSVLARRIPRMIERTRKGSDDPIVNYYNVSSGENGARLIESIKRQAELVSAFQLFHYFVLDEADNLKSGETMKSLKVAMNINPLGTIFILTTNNLPDIDAGVQSRSWLIPIVAAPAAHWLPRVHAIFAEYGVEESDAWVGQMLGHCNGDGRQITAQIRSRIAERLGYDIPIVV